MTEPHRGAARRRTLDFLENETDFQLGFVEAEQANPLTAHLGETAQADPEEAARMLLRVDRALADTFARCTRNPDFRQFFIHVEKVLRGGGRVVFSGCGATGRVSLNLEAGWRRALRRLAETLSLPELYELADRVMTVFTGGDYALIRSVENFEDYAILGYRQVEELDLKPGDLLIGITATAQTTSVMGTANAALDAGAEVEMVVCSDPAKVCERIPSVREMYIRPGVHSVYLPCGPMAVTGSTRMQSSTIEQLTCGAALQSAMNSLLEEKGVFLPECDYAAAFTALTESLLTPEAVKAVAEQASLEADTYAADGRMTYFADEFLIDILADTTERTPTFMTPPFAPTDSPAAANAWTFMKNPKYDTPAAWRLGLEHKPRCISWDEADYAALGVPVAAAPKITLKDLLGYRIGRERDVQRETHAGSIAEWIGMEAAPECFAEAAAGYPEKRSLTLKDMGLRCEPTETGLFEHLAVKLVMNTVSTVCMAKLGRLTGNCMTYVSLSNKKLVDRSARLIAQECGVSYERALEELFLTEEEHGAPKDEDFGSYSPARTTIERLKKEM